MGKEATENEFEKYNNEYSQSEAIQVIFKQNKKMLERIFKSYSKSSKRGVGIIPLRTFKMSMRDLGVIPHIATEYKCA